MTVVAYRSGVMAADSLAHMGECRFGENVKIARDDKGVLCGASGLESLAVLFLKLFTDLQAYPWDARHTSFDYTDGRALLALPCGKVYTYESQGWSFAGAPYAAIGLGWQVAIGAMDAGADAVQAVRITCYRNLYCDYPIHTHSHDVPELGRITNEAISQEEPTRAPQKPSHARRGNIRGSYC